MFGSPCLLNYVYECLRIESTAGSRLCGKFRNSSFSSVNPVQTMFHGEMMSRRSRSGKYGSLHHGGGLPSGRVLVFGQFPLFIDWLDPLTYDAIKYRN